MCPPFFSIESFAFWLIFQGADHHDDLIEEKSKNIQLSRGEALIDFGWNFLEKLLARSMGPLGSISILNVPWIIWSGLETTTRSGPCMRFDLIESTCEKNKSSWCCNESYPSSHNHAYVEGLAPRKETIKVSHLPGPPFSTKHHDYGEKWPIISTHDVKVMLLKSSPMTPDAIFLHSYVWSCGTKFHLVKFFSRRPLLLEVALGKTVFSKDFWNRRATALKHFSINLYMENVWKCFLPNKYKFLEVSCVCCTKTPLFLAKTAQFEDLFAEHLSVPVI